MKTLGKPVLILMLLFLMTVSLATLTWAKNNAEPTVNSVEVQLNISGNIYQGLQERIEYSINRVGEKLLISQPISFLKNNQDVVEQTIYNVVSKVLTGFRTETVDLFLGEHTKIIIRLTPLEPYIADIALDVHFSNIDPEMVGLTDGALAEVRKELNKIFMGLPVNSVGWADNIFSSVIRYLVDKELPGFEPTFTIEAGSNTKIKMNLCPQGTVASTVNVMYDTTDIPIWLVRSKMKNVQKKLTILKGLPLEFMIHYRPNLEEYFEGVFNDLPEISRLGSAVKVEITPGEKTNVTLKVNSIYFRTRLQAGHFMGQQDSFSHIEGYLGYQLNNSEIYTRLYTGKNPDGLTKIGFKMPLSTNFSGGFEYGIDQNYKSICMNYLFERGDYLELNLGIDQSPNKALIGIKVGSNLNLEIVKYDREYGLELIFVFW